MKNKIPTALLALTLPLCLAAALVVALATISGGSGSTLNAQLVAADAYGSPSGTPCPLGFFGIRGSGEHSGYGSTIGSMEASLHKLVPSVDASYINYPAINVPLPSIDDFLAPGPIGLAIYATQLITYHSAYNASVANGVHNLLSMYNNYESGCPGQPVVFAGYSQGADVATQVYDSLPQAARSHVILVLFGDPHFDPAQPWVDQGTYNPNLQAILVRFFHDQPHSFAKSDSSHVETWCDNGDVVCNFSWSNAFDCALLLPANYCLHEFIYSYSDATSLAAWWAYNVWKKGIVS